VVQLGNGDTGMGLFDYLSNATIDRWLKDKVLLQPDTNRCAIPKGIFTTADGKSSQGAMLRMMAYGGESNFAHPPRPPIQGGVGARLGGAGAGEVADHGDAG